MWAHTELRKTGRIGSVGLDKVASEACGERVAVAEDPWSVEACKAKQVSVAYFRRQVFIVKIPSPASSQMQRSPL